MYIIPIIGIVASLGVVLFVVVRHAPVLANLSVDSIAQVREKKFKDEIVSKKLKRGMENWFLKVMKFVKPMLGGVVKFVESVKHRANESRLKNKSSVEVKSEGVNVSQIESLFGEFEILVKDGNWDECEKKLIGIIEIDHKNVDAFAALGQVYFEKKNYDEAKQTLEHAIKLGGEHDESYFDLAMVCRAMGDRSGCLESINKAVLLNKNNPRFLDLYLEVLIEEKDGEKAKEVLGDLRRVNGDNAKLGQFEKSVSEL